MLVEDRHLHIGMLREVTMLTIVCIRVWIIVEEGRLSHCFTVGEGGIHDDHVGSLALNWFTGIIKRLLTSDIPWVGPDLRG